MARRYTRKDRTTVTKPSDFAAFSDGPRPLGLRPRHLRRRISNWLTHGPWLAAPGTDDWMALADATQERRADPAEMAFAEGPDFDAWEREFARQQRGRM